MLKTRKKRTTKLSSLLALVIIISIAMATLPFNSIAVYAATNSASTVTINVNAKNVSTIVPKINKNLWNEKEVTLKVQAKNKSEATKLVKKAARQIGYENKMGVVFNYTYDTSKTIQKKKYYYFKITKEDALTYKYACKFTDKLWKSLKARMNADKDVIATTKYLNAHKDWDWETIRSHVIYAMELCYVLEEDGIYLLPDDELNCWHSGEGQSLAKKETNDVKDHTKYFKENLMGESLGHDYEIGRDVYAMISYEQFMQPGGVYDTIKDEYNIFYEPIYNAKLMNATNFCDLSDFLKMYAISKQGYFTGDYDKGNGNVGRRKEAGAYCPGYYGEYNLPEFYMRYNYRNSNYSYKPYKTLKLMYEGKLEGQCGEFANAELLIAKQYGIKGNFIADYKYNHGWSEFTFKNVKNEKITVQFNYALICPYERRVVNNKCGIFETMR